MSWVKLGDEFPMHPKVLRVGPTGLALFVSGLCYSSRYLTDGVIELGFELASERRKFYGDFRVDGEALIQKNWIKVKSLCTKNSYEKA